MKLATFKKLINGISKKYDDAEVSVEQVSWKKDEKGYDSFIREIRSVRTVHYNFPSKMIIIT